MLGNGHFYNRTIRKIVVAFGTLFNDLEIVRYSRDGNTSYERFKVPLSYGPKEKYITRLSSDPDLLKSFGSVIPRMSFNLEGITYDPSRKQMTMNKNFTVSGQNVYYQYAPVPYNFEFSMSIYVRNTEDGTQLIEQILPFFTPDFTITIDLVKEMSQKYDLPVILESVTPEIEYEGDLISTRMVIWNLNFTVKSYIFPPVKDANEGGLITQANTNIYIDSRAKNSQKVYVDYANGNGVFTTGETIRVVNKPITGSVTYFSNNSTGTLIVENMSDFLEEDYIIEGDYSGAKYTIDMVDLTPIKAVSIITTPDPIDASPEDSFGFNETITEWPETLL
jgi:FlaG/FlaF family flagellin (archaellin)